MRQTIATTNYLLFRPMPIHYNRIIHDQPVHFTTQEWCVFWFKHVVTNLHPDSKVHGANMGPIWGRQNPGGPHVGPMNFAIWVVYRTDSNTCLLEIDGSTSYFANSISASKVALSLASGSGRKDEIQIISKCRKMEHNNFEINGPTGVVLMGTK